MIKFKNRGHVKQEVSQNSLPFPEVWITGTGLSCLAGDRDFALLGAVAAPISGACPDPILGLALPGIPAEAPVLTARVTGCEGLDHPGERMTALLHDALTGLMDKWPEDLDGLSVLVLMALPDAGSHRGAALYHLTLKKDLTEDFPALIGSDFRIVSLTDGISLHLDAACRDMAQGRWQAILFCGVDTLVDAVTCSELAEAGRVMTTASGEGLIPGEAGAAVLLQPAPAAGRLSGIRIRGIGAATEPFAGAADCHQMTGLAEAIEQALKLAGLIEENLDGIILPHGGDAVEALEWYQVRQSLWPPAKSSQDQPTDSPPELRPHLALGEIGAAAMPLSLVLACGRFAFHHPRISNLVVCEIVDPPVRGAVVLASS